MPSNVCSDGRVRWDATAAGRRRRGDAARHAVDPRAAAQRAGARVPRRDAARGAVPQRAERRPGGFGDAVPLDDQPVPGLPPCMRLLPVRGHPGPDGRRPREAHRGPRVGDEIVGTEQGATYRHSCRTGCWRTGGRSSPPTGSRLADGTEIVASGDHRFLTRPRLEARHRDHLRAGPPSAPDHQRRADGRRRLACRRRSPARLPPWLSHRDGARRRHLAVYRYARPGRVHGTCTASGWHWPTRRGWTGHSDTWRSSGSAPTGSPSRRPRRSGAR